MAVNENMFTWHLNLVFSTPKYNYDKFILQEILTELLSFYFELKIDVSKLQTKKIAKIVSRL